MKKPTRQQIKQHIGKLKKMLAESEDLENKVSEAVTKWGSLKNVKRSTKDALEAAKGAAPEAGDPMAELVQRHGDAVKAALKACRNELGNSKDKDKSKMDSIKFQNNCIKHGEWVHPKSGYMVIAAYLYPQEKKNVFKRLFTGSMGNWMQTVGVVALKNYVKAFLGESYAKHVTGKTVFDAVGDEDSQFPDRIAYYMAFRLTKQGKELDESRSKKRR